MTNIAHSITKVYTGTAPSEFPQAKSILDKKISYEGRSLKVMSRDDLPQIASIFEGSALSVAEIFFPKTFNAETRLMQELVIDLIHNTEAVQFEFGAKVTDTKMMYKGKTYDFYDVMKKIKWDLISLDNSTLDRHLLNLSEHKYNSSYYTIPEAPYGKRYLYTKLHKTEKAAISDYGSIGSTYNRFLRATVENSSYSLNQRHFVSFLCKTAVLCSGLNKIPPSKEFNAPDSYAYRCMSDAKGAEGESIMATYTEKMRDHQKIKELGFTGVAYKKPQAGFLGAGYEGEKSCLKVYANPRRLAKDISGLSGFSNECECLFLPNTKELIMREVVYNPEANYYGSSKGERHIYLTKLVSKRQGVT